jgi:hypothetical protein
VTQFLQGLDNSGFSQWVRYSGSLWSYPTILLLHTYGMGALVGLVIAIDARLLGLASSVPLAPLRRLFPLIWAAFWLNAVTGTMLLVSDASRKVPNVDFWIKMILIVLAVTNLRRIQALLGREADVLHGVMPVRAKALAVMSIICWLGAITAGRLLAYVGSAQEF